MTDRAYILAIISDLTKDATGCRIRADFASMTDAELQREFDYYDALLVDNSKRECIERLNAQKEWEQSIQSLIDIGAGTAGRAIEWDMQAEGVDPRDFDFYCYLKGISYELHKRISDEVRTGDRLAA